MRPRREQGNRAARRAAGAHPVLLPSAAREARSGEVFPLPTERGETLIMSRDLRLVGLGPLALVASCATAAHAETDHLWPRFGISAGAYDISVDDEIRIDGTIGSSGREIDLDADLGLPDSNTVLTLGLEWAFARRHSVELGYAKDEREGSRSIFREIEIGDTVFPIGTEASVSFETTVIEGAYTYWFVRKDDFGFGGSFGLVDLGLDAKVSATVRSGSSGVTLSEEASASTDLPVPMIGIALKGSPIDRLVLYGRGRVLPSISVGDYDGEAGIYTVGAEFFVIGPLALGVSYDGSYYKADVDNSSWRGSIDLVSKGWHGYLRAAF
jgi:hypothetical protein